MRKEEKGGLQVPSSGAQMGGVKTRSSESGKVSGIHPTWPSPAQPHLCWILGDLSLACFCRQIQNKYMGWEPGVEEAAWARKPWVGVRLGSAAQSHLQPAQDRWLPVFPGGSYLKVGPPTHTGRATHTRGRVACPPR
jgi:hypothetical protein